MIVQPTYHKLYIHNLPQPTDPQLDIHHEMDEWIRLKLKMRLDPTVPTSHHCHPSLLPGAWTTLLTGEDHVGLPHTASLQARMGCLGIDGVWHWGFNLR